VTPPWPVAKLGKVVEFLDHRRRPITEADRVPGPYPYYGANGQQDSVAGHLFDEKLVLLAEDGGHFDNPSRGIAYRVEGRCWVNNHAHVLRPTALVDWAYLGRVLENRDVGRHISGTTRAKLTKAGASEIEIPLPPIEEQRRIAAILDKADGLRAKRRAALAHLDTLTEAIFIDMFGDVGGRASTQPIRLGDIAVSVDYGLTASAEWELVGPRFLRITDIQDDSVDWSKVPSCVCTEREAVRAALRPGDIVFARTGATTGKSFLVENCPEDAVFASYLIRVRLGNRAEPLFVAHYFRSRDYWRQITSVARGAAQPGINASSLRELLIPLPTIEEQRRFSATVGALGVPRLNHLRSYRAMDELFTSVQQRAFSGAL